MKKTPRIVSTRLVNGSIGDPVLYVEYPGKDKVYMFDGGDNARLSPEELAKVAVLCLSHHHMDHFIDFDRILRANLDSGKTLHIFGPDMTIARIYGRIRSYEIQDFPFQKLVFHLHELHEGKHREAMLACRQKIPEPEISESDWTDTQVYEDDDVAIEAVATDHTCPGLAFAVIEKATYHPHPGKLNAGVLRPGDWVSHVLKLLREESPRDTAVAIGGGEFTLGNLEKMYFVKTKGARIVFITDTAWSEAVKPAFLRLAHHAKRLYCDCFYARAHLKQAERYRHMIAEHAGELARTAGVEELVLMHFSKRYAGRYQLLVEEAQEMYPEATAVWD